LLYQLSYLGGNLILLEVRAAGSRAEQCNGAEV
jgi:hypothetical protein